MDTSQLEIAGIIALVAPGLVEMESSGNNGSTGVRITESGGSTTGSGQAFPTKDTGQNFCYGNTGTAKVMSWENAVNACSALNVANSGNGYWGVTNWRMRILTSIFRLNLYPLIATMQLIFPIRVYSIRHQQLFILEPILW